MKSLRSFLLEEATLHESKSVPDGFAKIQLAGRLTNQVRDLLDLEKGEKMNLDNENIKANTKTGREDIVRDLKLGSANTFAEIFEKIASSNKLRDIFTGDFERYQEGNTKGVKIQLAPGFDQIGGTHVATLKFVKFWCTCACRAAGIPQSEAENYKYFENKRTDELLVIK